MSDSVRCYGLLKSARLLCPWVLQARILEWVFYTLLFFKKKKSLKKILPASLDIKRTFEELKQASSFRSGAEFAFFTKSVLFQWASYVYLVIDLVVYF